MNTYIIRLIKLSTVFIFIMGCSHISQFNSHDWKLVWQDEFDGPSINYNDWTFDLGTGAANYTEYGVSSTEFVPDGFPNDHFSVRWDGFVIPEFTEDYTFNIVADDGVRLWVSDKLIIDNWIPQAPTELSGSHSMSANKRYPIRIEYFEESGGETLILGWQCSKFDKTLIPSDRMFTTTGESGLKGRYFSNQELSESADSPATIRIDPILNWTTGTGWGNNELQFYTNDEQNVRISDGRLIIEAHKKNYRGSNYTSSRIKTTNSWKYGRFEMKAKLPKGRGTWAAIWGLPTDWTYGNWPGSGEIDIVEHVGYDQGNIIASVHTQKKSGNLYQSDQQASLIVEDATDTDHIYILEWYEDKLIVFVDDKKIFSFSNDYKGWEQWPFDERFHILLNIAVGGNWGGSQGIDDTVFPARMEIDYIRVYQ
jgi:beta-glucanase (GH16 family)